MLPRLLDLASCLTMLHLVAAVGAGWKKATLVYCHLEAKLAVERCAGLLGFLQVFLFYGELFALAWYWGSAYAIYWGT